VAFTPLVGSLAFPLLVPLLMLRYNLAVGLIGAVLIGTLWFVAMLRSSEMPGHS
jgi:peptidoglycan/LPS O-acetylase OafA/YrhL